ncbi:hypothetical protein AAH450_13325 [Erwinia sp. P7711]|uniref:hypothetical protein n=1 Tax=Erwinia sp. P7711 TaxID=3141451 RepID=UPI003187C50B
MMLEVINSMQKIEHGAKRNADINRVINGIANQANILALTPRLKPGERVCRDGVLP